MRQIRDALSTLPARHRLALEWFAQHTGQEKGWPEPLPDGTLLVSKAKGIYKPSWTRYALSVRQSLGGPYPHREPAMQDDGTWFYLYFQENPEPDARDSQYTNRALMDCLRDGIPVGVIRQTRRSPQPTYQVLGLALVAGWEAGYFVLGGFSQEGEARDPSPRLRVEALTALEQRSAQLSGAFDPQSIMDARERIIASIVRRRGQSEFRRTLLRAYQARCAVTGCDAEEVLEACHVIPYRGPATDHPSNGLLLRADIHTLFDLGLLAVDTAAMTILVAEPLWQTAYGHLQGAPLQLPTDPGLAPSREALDLHRQWAGH